MITLDKDVDVKFGEKDKWPLLFAIADIYKRFSSKDSPISVERVSEILQSEYGIAKVDRHAVQDYRNRLEEYFGYTFEEVKKKGYYLHSVAYVLNDDELANIAIMIQCNKTFEIKAKDYMLESLEHYASTDRAKSLIQEVRKIHAFYGNEAEEQHSTIVIQRLLYAVKSRRKIVIRYFNPWNTDLKSISLYPHSVFMKDNEFYLLGMTYWKKPDYLISNTEIIKIRNIEAFKYESKSGSDPYQNDEDYLTIYPFKKDPYKIRVEEYISMLGDLKERTLSTRRVTNKNIVAAEVEIKGHKYDDLVFVLDSLETKYGYGGCLSVKRFIDEKNALCFNKRLINGYLEKMPQPQFP